MHFEFFFPKCVELVQKLTHFENSVNVRIFSKYSAIVDIIERESRAEKYVCFTYDLPIVSLRNKK